MSHSEQICTFSLDGLFLGIGVNEVQEVLLSQTLTPVPLAHPIIAGLINMRGQIVVAIDLRKLLNLSPRDSDTRPPVNIIVRNGAILMSLLVDEVGDVLDVETQLFAPPPDAMASEARNLFRGAYQLQPQLLLVLDTNKAIEAIVARATSRQSR